MRLACGAGARGTLVLAVTLVALAGCRAESSGGSARILITRVPPAGAGGPFRLDIIEGRVEGGRPGQRVVLFARSGLWYVQPTADERFTDVADDSRWTNSTHIGTEYAALLVEPGYTPPLTMDALPAPGDGVVAVATVRGRPFWSEPSFLLVTTVAAALFALGLYRARARRLRRELAVRFEERLAERTRLARELQDTLLQDFVGAAMQLHVALEQLPEGSPGKPLLQGVGDKLARVAEEGRRTVNALRAPVSDPRELEEALARVGAELPVADRPALSVVVSGKARPLRPILRDEVYRIGREALTNALKHAGALRVEAELEYTSAGLRLVVRDDGRGIEPRRVEEHPEQHRGIGLMRDRAEAMGASLEVRSRPEAGTEIVLFVPAAVGFETEAGRNGGEGARVGWRAQPRPPILETRPDD